MNRYKTTDTISLFTGLVGLDAQQAKPRLQAGHIIPAGIGVYEVRNQIQFKTGEVILLDTPKGLAHCLECLDTDPVTTAEPAAEPAAEPVTTAPVKSIRRGGRR